MELWKIEFLRHKSAGNQFFLLLSWLSYYSTMSDSHDLRLIVQVLSISPAVQFVFPFSLANFIREHAF